MRYGQQTIASINADLHRHNDSRQEVMSRLVLLVLILLRIFSIKKIYSTTITTTIIIHRSLTSCAACSGADTMTTPPANGDIPCVLKNDAQIQIIISTT